MTVRHCFQPLQTIAACIMYNLSPQVGLLGMRRELRNRPEGAPEGLLSIMELVHKFKCNQSFPSRLSCRLKNHSKSDTNLHLV